MPKKLIDLERKIIAVAKEIIATEGYEALSMRSIAQKSKVAVGTIYNYYPDKNAILGGIVGIDWVSLEAELFVKFKTIPSLKEGIKLLYDAFISFSKEHQDLFSYFTTSGNAAYYASYRNFVDQGSELLRILGKQFGIKANEHRYGMAASMFSYAIHYPNVPYVEIEDSILKLLQQ